MVATRAVAEGPRRKKEKRKKVVSIRIYIEKLR
jgi:hypothetical protein